MHLPLNLALNRAHTSPASCAATTASTGVQHG